MWRSFGKILALSGLFSLLSLDDAHAFDAKTPMPKIGAQDAKQKPPQSSTQVKFYKDQFYVIESKPVEKRNAEGRLMRGVAYTFILPVTEEEALEIVKESLDLTGQSAGGFTRQHLKKAPFKVEPGTPEGSTMEILINSLREAERKKQAPLQPQP